MTDSLSQHCPNCEAQAAEIGALHDRIQKLLSNIERLIDSRAFQAAEIEKLRGALKEVFEAWAGSEGFIPETAPEGYLLYLTKRMAHIACAALGETK